MNLLTVPDNPAPDGATVGQLRASDGVSLRYARFAPPPQRRGTICLFPGRAEFIEKYFEVVGELRARGFAVAILDWRGQGLSERALADARKGHVGNFAEYDRDLETFVREIVLPDCPPPHFALAHSMGGSILLRAAAHGRRWFDRMVITSPMIALAGAPGNTGLRRTARWLRRLGFARSYVPSGSATALFSKPFDGNPLTSDPVRYARTAALVEAHPQLALGSPTVGWLAAAYDAMDAFADPQYPPALRQPLLIIASGQDAVVSTAATAQFAARLRVGSMLTVPGARHEVMMEQDRFRAQFWAAFDAFVPGSEV